MTLFGFDLQKAGEILQQPDSNLINRSMMPLDGEKVAVLNSNDEANIVRNRVIVANPQALQELCELVKSFRVSFKRIMHSPQHFPNTIPSCFLPDDFGEQSLNILLGLVRRKADLCDSIIIFFSLENLVGPTDDFSAFNDSSLQRKLEVIGNG
jgi:hypothetical protein